jgi:fructokinase
MRFGIDFGGTKIEIIALDDTGAERFRRRIPTPRDDYPASIAAVRDLVRAAEAATGRPGSIGLGIPGAISPATGLVKNANSTWLIGRPFDRDLGDAIGRPVRVENDANCFALSEAVDGAGAGADVVFGVILGTGVGAGIVVRGHVLRGRHAIAGEWGHNPLPWPADAERPGPACYCGRHGCIETWLSGPGLARDHARNTGRTLSPEAIVAGLRARDASCLASFARWRERLARGLAHVINILDPDVIVPGGGMGSISETYQGLGALVAAHVFSDVSDTPIRPPVHGASGGVRGAAWLWGGPKRD